MTEFASLRPKSYRYFPDNSNENKKANGKKKSVTKKPLNFKIINTVQKQLNMKIK